MFRREVCNGGTQYACIAGWKDCAACLIHLRCAFHRCADDGFVLGPETHGAAHHFHRSASSGAFFGKCASHFPAAVVAYKAYWVILLMGGSGCNQNTFSLQVLCALCESLCLLPQNFLGFFHSAFALQMACKKAGLRFNDMVAIRFQQGKIVLRSGMCVHIQVHRRSYKDRCFHAQIGGDEHIVGYAVRHFAYG